MFNYQYIAVRIEHTLQLHGYAKAGDADIIRSNPMAFMDAVLKQYEKASEEHDRKSADFWEVYKNYEAVALMSLVMRWLKILQMMLLTCSNKAKAGA